MVISFHHIRCLFLLITKDEQMRHGHNKYEIIIIEIVADMKEKQKAESLYLSDLPHVSRSDLVGIQTQDLQNRNLTLYSAKLPSLLSSPQRYKILQ